jgi:hypothetical protein
MSMTYNSLVSQTATITAITSSVLVNGDNNFQGIFGSAIDYAEGRIYRDLDLPITSVTDISVSLSSGIRSVLFSTTQGEILSIDAFNIFTPAGATSSYATRIPLVPATKAIVDTIYPSAASSNCGQPEFFARVSNVEMILGPTPDQGYGTEVIGVIRPGPLSASNSSTWLTQNLPELMQAAVMVFMAGHMRDFGAQSDNPQMAQSWESQYQALKASAADESKRMTFESAAWTSQSPSPAATPPRA